MLFVVPPGPTSYGCSFGEPIPRLILAVTAQAGLATLTICWGLFTVTHLLVHLFMHMNTHIYIYMHTHTGNDTPRAPPLKTTFCLLNAGQAARTLCDP